MNTLREKSGGALAVLDYIDFMAAQQYAKDSPFLMLLYLVAWRGCNRGFTRETERIADTFADLLRVAQGA